MAELELPLVNEKEYKVNLPNVDKLRKKAIIKRNNHLYNKWVNYNFESDDFKKYIEEAIDQGYNGAVLEDLDYIESYSALRKVFTDPLPNKDESIIDIINKKLPEPYFVYVPRAYYTSKLYLYIYPGNLCPASIENLKIQKKSAVSYYD